MLEKERRAAALLLVSGARGEPGEGCWSACRMSWAPAMMASTDEARGMVTFVGNHSSVSEVRSARVSQTQTQ
jgi:hypothetical protein